MKKLSIVIILLLSWTASSAYYIRTDSIPAVDSTLMYVMPHWVANAMTYEVQKGRQCNELVKFQANEIQKGIDVEVKLTEESAAKTVVIVSLTQEKALLKAELKDTNGLLDVQADMTKHEKVQKRKWKFGTFVAVTVIVLREVFSR